MKIKLSDIMSVPDKVYETEVEFSQERLSISGRDCAVAQREPVVLRLANLGERKIGLTLHTALTLYIPCDRCLREVRRSYIVEIDRQIDLSKEDETSVNSIADGELDVDLLLYEAVCLQVPMKHLCSADCKGLCPVCGANRNEVACGCDSRVPDPRMADALSALDTWLEENSPAT